MTDSVATEHGEETEVAAAGGFSRGKLAGQDGKAGCVSRGRLALDGGQEEARLV